MFNMMNFLLGMAVLKNQGVEASRANQLALISSFLPPTTGLIIAMAIGRNEK